MLNYCSGWYQTLSGESALKNMDELCADIMSETFGYYAIQTGVLSGFHDLLQFSRIAAGFSVAGNNIASDNKNDIDTPQISVISNAEQLPIATDNIDLVVASHVLELSKDPHQVLREIDRVLVPEGHCILIGFNPFALSQIRRLLGTAFNRNKNDYKMRSVPRVRDWFSLLGFELLDVHYMGMRPGIKNKKIFESMSWLERWGDYAGPILGNMYILHVKKQVVAMHPHKKVWKAPAVLSGGKVVLNGTAQRIRRENYSEL